MVFGLALWRVREIDSGSRDVIERDMEPGLGVGN